MFIYLPTNIQNNYIKLQTGYNPSWTVASLNKLLWVFQNKTSVKAATAPLPPPLPPPPPSSSDQVKIKDSCTLKAAEWRLEKVFKPTGNKNWRNKIKSCRFRINSVKQTFLNIKKSNKISLIWTRKSMKIIYFMVYF